MQDVVRYHDKSMRISWQCLILSVLFKIQGRPDTEQNSMFSAKTILSQHRAAQCIFLMSTDRILQLPKTLTRRNFKQFPSPLPPGNCGAFAHVVIPGGGAFAILSRLGGWAFSYIGATPGHLTRMFSKVPWTSSSGKTRRLSIDGLSVRD